jgi:hypothetical protein
VPADPDLATSCGVLAEKLKDPALIDAVTPVKTVTSPELIDTVVVSVLLKLT